MKKLTQIFSIAIITLTIGLFGTSQIIAGGKDHSGHGQAMEHSGHQKKAGHDHEMDHSGHAGESIHEASVEGYQLAYHLIDMKERMAAMKAMKDMKDMKDMKGMKHMEAMKDMSMTHHLMVYVQGPDGRAIEDAKVGYLVEGPDGSKQKVMTMGMKGGFGADVNLEAKGTYTIKTKAIAQGEKILDSFTYEVK